MKKILYPDMYVNTILDIPLDVLKQNGKKAFIVDLDNTVTFWNSCTVAPDVISWFDKIKSEGFKACILSNNGEQRIRSVARTLDMPFIHRAQKPRSSSFMRAVKLMQVKEHETVVIGDQIFTDVLGGNRAGLYTILVAPLDKREFIGTKISRQAERFVLKRLKKQL